MLHRQIFNLGLAASAAASPLAPRAYNATNTTMAQSFKDVPITKDIQYIPCFDNYTCTNIEVPLDYDDESAGTTHIAFLKYAAAQQPALGDVIFNPGGPGGSGVEDIPLLLQSLVALIGDSYNIVGMDPRGVSNSGPLLDCFDGKPWVRDYAITQLYANLDPRSDVSISLYYANAGAFGSLCTRNLNETAKYVNTPATARDMLHYAELLAESKGEAREEAVVNYYGASYGTLLGATFATLYPERVGKFVLDAVVDGDDYYYGNWSQNILQADASVEAFFTYCAEAGPNCVFNRNGSTAADLKQRFDKILADLEESPLPVSDPNFVQSPTALTHFDIRSILMITLYNPPVYWPILAIGLVALENGDGNLIANVSGKGALPQNQCDYLGGPESVIPKEVVACNDNNGSFNNSEQSLVDLFKYQKELSTYIGDVWPTVVVPLCQQLNLSVPKNQLFGGKSYCPILL